MKKTLLSLFLTITMVLTACSGGEDVQDAPAPEPEQYTIGETGIGEHYNITLLAGETTDEVPFGDMLSKVSADGKVYLLLALKLENTTNEEQVAEMWEGTFVVDGREVDNVILAPEAEIQGEMYQRMSTDRILAGGETLTAYASTEIPAEWESCEFTYDGVTVVISAEEATPPPAPPIEVYQVGEAAKTEHFNVTLVMGESMKQVEDTAIFYYEASEGKILLILLFDIENITEETRQLWERGNFELTVDGEDCNLTRLGSPRTTINLDGNAYDSFIPMGNYSGYELESGGHEVGYLAAEIPEEWSRFEITFDNAIFEGENNQVVE